MTMVDKNLSCETHKHFMSATLAAINKNVANIEHLKVPKTVYQHPHVCSSSRLVTRCWVTFVSIHDRACSIILFRLATNKRTSTTSIRLILMLIVVVFVYGDPCWSRLCEHAVEQRPLGTVVELYKLKVVKQTAALLLEKWTLLTHCLYSLTVIANVYIWN